MKHIIYILGCLFLLSSSLSAKIERRAAIDIGSGGTKVALAEVDLEAKQIVTLLFEASYPVPYQAALDNSSDGTFDEETRALGLKTFHEIKKLAESYQVTQIAAVATSAFRKANNAQEFVAEVEKQTQIAIRVIAQREEGEIAFFSALAAGGYDPQEMIVWDIGTGSLQMTTLNEHSEFAVYMGEEMGAVAFKSYIMQEIQEKESGSTPNPMTDDDFYFASSYARAFARKAFPLLKQKIKNQVPVVGIGRLFNNSVGPIGLDEGVITRSGLRHYIIAALNKADSELNNPFAHVDVTNCILTLAMMKALHIQEIHPVDTTTTKGMLINPHYWNY